MRFLNPAYLKIIAGGAALIAGMTAAGMWLHNDFQQRLQVLQEDNASLQSAIEENRNTIESLETSIEVANRVMKSVNEDFADIRRQNAEIRERLDAEELSKAAAEEPDTVAETLTVDTADSMRCFELLSGAELTEDEKNATTAEEFNTQCPWLFSTSDD